MDENGIPNFEEVAEVTNAATGLVGAIHKMLPGIAMRSTAKAESKITKRTLDDMDAARSWGKGAGLSDESIAALCNDIYMRNTRAERLEHVIELAKEDIDDDVELHEPEQSWAEEFQEHAKKACDEDTQRMWAAVLAGELENPGSFSKRTMDILSKMSKVEAEIFRKVCGFSTYLYNSNGELGKSEYPIPVLKMDSGSNSSYNSGEIFVSHISALASIGLMSRGVSQPITVPCKASLFFYTGTGLVEAINADASNDKEILFENGMFTPSGMELANVCGVGHDQSLEPILKEKLLLSRCSVNVHNYFV